MADMPSMPVSTAAISWTDSGNTTHIRVYSTDGYNAIERCWDGNGWTTGGFTAPAEQVSATCWVDAAGEHLRVYCTFEDKTVEYGLDPGTSWYQGSYTVS